MAAADKPQRKVIAATIGSALASLLVYILQAISGRTLPLEQTLALGTLLTAGVTFLAGYQTSNTPRPADRLTDRQVAMLEWIDAERTQDPPGWHPRGGPSAPNSWPPMERYPGPPHG